MPIHSTPLPSGQNLRSVSAAHDILGETPLWCDRTATLFWLDIDGKKLQRLDPALRVRRYASSATLAAVPSVRRRAFFLSLLLYEKLLWPHADD